MVLVVHVSQKMHTIVQYAESLKVDYKLNKKTIKANNKIRAKYNNQTDREDEQNIKYYIKREEKYINKPEWWNW